MLSLVVGGSGSEVDAVSGGDSIGVIPISWMTTERTGGSLLFEEEGEEERE